MSISAFSLIFNIIDTKSDHVLVYYTWCICVDLLYLPEANYYLMQTLCTKASHNNFSTLFFVFIFDWQHTIIFLIHCSLLSLIQISFDHPFCNHISDHPSTECFQIFSFLFSFDLLNSPVSLFLCS